MDGYKWVNFAWVNGSLGIDGSLGVNWSILPPFEYSYSRTSMARTPSRPW